MPPYNFPLDQLRPAGTLPIQPDWSSPFYERDPRNPMAHWPPEIMYVLDSHPDIKQSLVRVLAAEREKGNIK
ncbi:MAG: hypothetical protein JNK48_20505 [Bryobacterales bacterium]|nr:hypothetical protein [Bryobacterales bacterium]